MNAAGAINVYSTTTLVGNWCEDVRGKATLSHSGPTGVSEASAAYAPPPPAIRQLPTPSLEELDAYMMFAHGTHLADRGDAPARFLSVAHGMANGVNSATILNPNGLSAPREVARQEKCAARRAMVSRQRSHGRSAGL